MTSSVRFKLTAWENRSWPALLWYFRQPLVALAESAIIRLDLTGSTPTLPVRKPPLTSQPEDLSRLSLEVAHISGQTHISAMPSFDRPRRTNLGQQETQQTRHF